MEIKIRAWDKYDKVMCEVRGINWLEEIALCAPILPNRKAIAYRWKSIEDFEFMLFTGKQDKNKKDIYDGDIGRYQTAYVKNQKQEYGYRYILIKFDISSLEKIQQLLIISNLISQNNLEIIGNIYQNPELLESGK